MTVTADDVALWSKFTTPQDEELALLDRVITAVTDHVSDHYVVDDPLTAGQEQAVIIQCARMWRRRDTPEGVAAFADVQALRIDALDRDVALLLTPQFGFA